jgi:hypothetical protein
MTHHALKPIPVKKHKSRSRRAVEGTGAALALLGALEVVFEVLADGAVSPEVKLWARAIAAGIGVFIAAPRPT